MQDNRSKPTVTRIEMPELNEKNVLGKLGERCSYCSGYGFTNHIDGKSAGCVRCDQTGIEPVNTRDLAKKVDFLTESMGRIITLLEKK